MYMVEVGVMYTATTKTMVRTDSVSMTKLHVTLGRCDPDRQRYLLTILSSLGTPYELVVKIKEDHDSFLATLKPKSKIWRKITYVHTVDTL